VTPTTDRRVEDGIYILGDKSWSIDMQRYNFQSPTAVLPIRDGRLGRPAARCRVSGDHHRLLGCAGSRWRPSTWRLVEPSTAARHSRAVAAVSHGCPSRCSAGINVLTPARGGAVTDDRRTTGRRQPCWQRPPAGKTDETIVLVTDRADASLRWAGNSN